MSFTRRSFLEELARAGGFFVLTASSVPFTAYATRSSRRNAETTFRFPQGVASADPQPQAIVLWTRVVDDEGDGPVALRAQVASDEAFASVLLDREILAVAQFDHTVRCHVDGLEPGQTYYYRFLAPDGTASRTGRTLTAPAPNNMSRLNVAVMSCQHYDTGFFTAYRYLIADDAAAAAEDRVHIVLHVGDFIYENVGARMLDSNDEPIVLRNTDGSTRTANPYPSGGVPGPRGSFIPQDDIEDYRHLYRTYLSDPDLQDARARFPFVHVWDDHEVFNDYWQSYKRDTPIQRAKVIGNQAWFEYIPAALTAAEPGPSGANPACDFEPAQVENTPASGFDEDFLSTEPNNLAAIATLTIYRYLRWGSLVDLFLLDDRSYRGPRGVTSELLGADVYAYPDRPVPRQVVEILNAGRTANEGTPPETIEVYGKLVANPRRDSPRGSLLGGRQKSWLEASILGSKARWKVLGNSVPLMPIDFDARQIPDGIREAVLWSDGWDGYPMERREILTFLRNHRIPNVVSLSGDRHANLAGLVSDEFAGKDYALPEFAGTGVSAPSRFLIQKSIWSNDPVLSPLNAAPGERFGRSERWVPTLDCWLLHGAEAAKKLGESGNATVAEAASDPNINPDLIYADTHAYGYFTASFNSDRVDVTFICIKPPFEPTPEQLPAPLRRIRFKVESRNPGELGIIERVAVEGEQPLLGLRPN